MTRHSVNNTTRMGLAISLVQIQVIRSVNWTVLLIQLVTIRYSLFLSGKIRKAATLETVRQS